MPKLETSHHAIDRSEPRNLPPHPGASVAPACGDVRLERPQRDQEGRQYRVQLKGDGDLAQRSLLHACRCPGTLRSAPGRAQRRPDAAGEFLYRSEEHTSELQSLMRISYAVFCLQKKKPDK